MNIVFALLYLILFVSLVVTVNGKGKKRKMTIYWLPFRPVLMGLAVGLFLCGLGVFPILLILQVQIILSEFLAPVALITLLGTIAYWVPTAWFVRKFNGQSFDIALI